MSAHTPGPWRTVVGTPNPASPTLVVDRDSCIVAEVDGRGGAIGWANACLTAAAPELLTALEDILCVVRDREPLKAAALAAIAKAKGETS